MKKPDDYLWDGSGPTDPQVRRLETALGILRSKRPVPDATAAVAPGRRVRLPWLAPALAAAALVVLLASGAFLARHRIGMALSGWRVEAIEGASRVGSEPLEQGASTRLAPGRPVQTADGARARLVAGWIGRVDVEPRTTLELLQAGSGSHRLALRRGTIHARISAPPRFFSVETPLAVAVDMGCAYSLHVDDEGAAVLTVTAGWVSLQWRGRESFVPTGARCRTWAGAGPGAPAFSDADPGFLESLDRFDDPSREPASGAADLGRVLEKARARDALTLWHLLARIDTVAATDRARVHDRLAGFVAPPAGVTREGVLAGDRRMLESWWEALGLGSADWWRRWRHSIPEPR
ncbi:MAG TPA: hypothetical protein VFP98_09700 [Candidatus Polarisedimenticolia bacterium]|nr:hypothetical protein [Candidatus Polarisedimenticolia bacterium]